MKVKDLKKWLDEQNPESEISVGGDDGKVTLYTESKEHFVEDKIEL